MPAAVLPGVLVRQWFYALVGLAASLVLVACAAQLVKPTYQTQARVLLAPPVTSAGDNPLLDLGGLTQVADVVATSMLDDSTVAQADKNGAAGSYLVVRDPTTSAPILLITGNGKTAAQAQRTLAVATALVTPTLQKLQAQVDAPSRSSVRITTISRDASASPVQKTQLRAAIGAGALGLALTMLVIGLIDRLQRRPGRSAHASRRTAPRTEPTDEADFEFGLLDIAELDGPRRGDPDDEIGNARRTTNSLR